MSYPSDGLRVVERCRKGGCAAGSGPAIGKSGQAAAIDDADLRGRRSSYTWLPEPDARSSASFAAVQRVDDLRGGSPAVRTDPDLLATPRYATADDEGDLLAQIDPTEGYEPGAGTHCDTGY